MWLWKAGNIFLLLFLLLCLVVVCISCIRFYRSRQVWPLSSPSSTRRPSLIFTTCALCCAWSILHTFKQIFPDDLPCALYVFLAAGLIQGLCLVFEVRLYSLLFLFECTENLCNMNELRKQKAALVMDMEAEKKDNVAIAGGLQLQSPPHSRLHGMAAATAYQTPATLGTRHFEVQPAGSPVTNHDLRQSPLQITPAFDTKMVDGTATIATAAPLPEEPAVTGTMIMANPHLNAVSLSLQQAASKDNSAEPTPLSHVNRRLPQLDSAATHSSTSGMSAATPATLSVQLASRGMENPTSPSLGTSDWMVRRQTASTNNPLPAIVNNAALASMTPLTNHRSGLPDSNVAAVTPLLPPSHSPIATGNQPPMAHPGELARPQSLMRQPSPSKATNPSPTVVAVNSAVDHNNRAKVHFIEVEPNGRGSNSSATVNLLVSPKSNTTALTIPDDESASTLKAVPVGSGDMMSRPPENGDGTNVRRSYIQPNWFVNHRSLMKTRFLLKWVLGWNAFLYSVLVVLLFADSHDTSHLYHSTDAWNNLECNTMHVPGLQFMWVLVGVHLIFLLFGLHRLYTNFPMDGFYVKQELYMSAALGLLCIIIQLIIPNSIEAGLHRTAISPTLFLVDGSIVGFDVHSAEWVYFVPSDAFAVDLFFAILLPTIVCEIITEGTLWKVEPSNDTTDLLSTEVVSNLDELLQTKHGFASFFNFLKTEFTMQNLLYWRACKNFQSAIDDHRYLLFNTTESMTGDVGLAGGQQTGITSSSGDDQLLSGGGSSGDQHVMSELGSSGGLHTMNAPGARHSPHNSVLSLSVNNVGLKVHRAPAAIMAQHPLFVATSQLSQQQRSNVNQGSLAQHPSQVPQASGTHASARYLTAPPGVLENAHHLHHPPKNANLPPGAISPSLTSMNSKGAFGAINPYMVNNASLLNRMSGHGPGVLSHTGANPYRATEASALSLGGALLQVPHDNPNAGGTSLIAPLAAPGRSIFGNAHQAVVIDNHPAPTPEIAAAEAANPALRVARLQREAAAIAVEHSRLHAIKLLEKAKSIHDRFVRDGAPYEVSDIPPVLRANILEFMSLLQFEIKSPVDQVSDIGAIFVDSQDAIYALLQTDAFPRYLRSPFFQKFKSNNRARAALQQVRIQKLAKERAKKARREEYAAALATASMLNASGAQVTQGPRVGAGFSRIPAAGPATGQVAGGAAQRSMRPASLPAGVTSNVPLGIGAVLQNLHYRPHDPRDDADPMSSAANALRSAVSGAGPHSVAGRGTLDMETYYGTNAQQAAPNGTNAPRARSHSMSSSDIHMPDGIEASNDADGHFDPKGSVASRSHASPFASADSPLIRSSAHPPDHLFPGGPMLSPPASAPMSPDITAEVSQPLPQLSVITHLQRHTAVAPLPSSTNVPVVSPVAIHGPSSEDTVASLASTTLNNSAATSPNTEAASKSPSLHAPSGTNTSPTRMNKTLSSADGTLTRHEPDSPAGSAHMSRRDDESMILQQSASLSVSRTASVEGYGVDKQLLAAHMRLKPLAHESSKVSSTAATRDAMQASVIIHPLAQSTPSVVE